MKVGEAGGCTKIHCFRIPVGKNKFAGNKTVPVKKNLNPNSAVVKFYLKKYFSNNNGI